MVATWETSATANPTSSVFATQQFPIKDLSGPPAANASVEFGSIDDWAAVTDSERPLSAAP